MDQIKTGKFLKELRREKGWTQSEFSEKLGVSEKTVSKWETGRGLPEVSLMLPVCECLGITVNELLCGERLSGEQYRARAEENLLDFACDRTSPKTKLIVSIVACILVLAAYLTIALVVSYCPMPVWARIVLLVCGFLGVVAVIALILLIAVNIEIFTCPKCGKRFVPTLVAYILGPHTIKKRRLKCPHCGQKSWCVSNLRAGDASPEYRKKD